MVAEGAGEEMLGSTTEGAVDAGGNKKLPEIGPYMVKRIVEHFRALGKEATVKYIDPSYTIRSVPANSDDAFYCHTLGVRRRSGARAPSPHTNKQPPCL